jgi:sugar phosphate isomerase/epimerase
MRLGLCVGSNEALADEAMAAGFDYVEMAACELVSEAGFCAAQRLRPPVCNLFLPGGLSFYGPWQELSDYAERMLPRAHEVGAEILVVGSGGGRRSVARHSSAREAESEFWEALVKLQEMAEPYGLRLVPESLRSEETDVLNLSGGVAREAMARGLAWTADAYHILQMGESWADALPAAPAHVHLSDGQRKWPMQDDPEMHAAVEAFSRVGWPPRVSLECGGRGYEGEWSDALRQARALLGQRP